MDFIERFREFSKERNMLSDRTPTLLTVSGGIDSVVMAYLFQETGLPFGIAHCNFQLRGLESDGDALFVQELAAGLGVPFFVKSFDTKTYAEGSGISTQMAARKLRYEWFAEIADKEGFEQIATAHNLNDSVETALLNFIRGTGLSGLRGMYNTEVRHPVSGKKIPVLRPLLFASRDEILAFAAASKISWREDSSNASHDYARNYLRHQIVPLITELNPNFLHTAERNLARIRESKENADFLTRQFLGIGNDSPESGLAFYSIEKQKLKQLPSPLRALRELLKSSGFSEEQARQLADNLDQVGFEIVSDAGWQVLCDRTEIVVRKLSEDHHPTAIIVHKDDLMVRLPDGSSMFLMTASPTPPFPDGSESVLINGEKVQFPLFLRHWQEGDSFQPFGMGGQNQKLQDFFTNQKLSRIEKEAVWLLFNGDEKVIWIVGMRLDERFRIQEGSEKGLKISWR